MRGVRAAFARLVREHRAIETLDLRFAFACASSRVLFYGRMDGVEFRKNWSSFAAIGLATIARTPRIQHGKIRLGYLSIRERKGNEVDIRRDTPQ